MSRRSPIFSQIRRDERAEELRHEAIVGIVVDNKDPDKLGRVKVKFPTLSEDASHWAPISALGAGADRGWFFLPEIDDEVLVMFAHGELSRPVVLGALWNGVDKPPESNGGGNERRLFHSRCGHELIFDDDGDKIVFQDGNGIGVIEITADAINVTAKQGDIQTQSPNGQTNVKAKDIAMKCASGANLKSDANMKVSAESVTVDGGGKLDISGAKVDMNASGGAPDAASAEGSPESVDDPI